MARLLVDLVIAFTLLEAAFLVLRHRLSGCGPAPGLVLPNLASGFCLLLAVRVALAGGDWVWLAACLAGSGVAHAADVIRR